MAETEKKPRWTFLTNHAHVMFCLWQSSSIRMRDIALQVGITERAVQRIIAELIEDGYIRSVREGRCNSYSIQMDLPLKHPLEAHRCIADLLGLIQNISGTSGSGSADK